MKLYTTYFDNLNNIDPDITPISISGNTPIWFNGNIQKKLVPNVSMMSNGKLKEECKEDYIEQLNSIKVSSLIKSLNKITKSNDIVLVSDELPDVFSHRKVLLEWLKRNNVKVEEI